MRVAELTGRLGLVLATLLYFGTSATQAQDDETQPGREASRLLPDATVIGPDWTQSDILSPDLLARYSFTMSPDVFREGAASVYLGPDGSRIVLVVLLTTDSRVAIRKSWEDATELFNSFAYRIDEDYDRRQALETMDPPASCVEAKRTEGIETGYFMPFGGTMCAVDPDIVALAMVSGEVNGLSGVEAADAVTDLMFRGTGLSDSGDRATTVELNMVDIDFEPAELTIPANTDVMINLTNSGALPHAFELEDGTVESDEIPGGSTGSVTVNLPRGEYSFICPVPGHADAGMVGTLIVE